MPPFEIIERPLGSLQRHVLRHCSSGAELEILTGHGALLQGFRRPVNGVLQEFVEGYASESDLRERFDSSHCGARLTPFPNRVRDGQFAFGGRTCQLDLNFPVQEHAIHGLLFAQPWTVEELHCTDEYAALGVACRWAGEHPGYPWAFRARTRFLLHADGAVSVFTEVLNEGDQSLPLGEGWHPYFMLGGKVDEWLLQIPPARRLHTDDRGIPTGDSRPETDFTQPTRVGERFLDGCYRVEDVHGRSEVLLQNPAAGLQARIWQDNGDYRYVQFYSPPHRTSLAVEPMTCPADAYNSGTDLLVLSPGGTHSFLWGFRIEGDGLSGML